MTNPLLEQDQAQVLAPEHVTPAVVYLCSDDCPSGHIIAADHEAVGVAVDEPDPLRHRHAIDTDDVVIHYPRQIDVQPALLDSPGPLSDRCNTWHDTALQMAVP
jgi:hypothetical protein